MLFDALYRDDPLENPSAPITDEAIDDLFTSCFSSVSPHMAMKLSAVYSCIYVLSSNFAQLPMHVLRKVGDNIAPATDHPAYYLVHDEPNALQTSYKWREIEMARALGWGNAYTHIVRDSRGRVTNLVPKDPWSTEPIKINGSGRYVYVSANEDGKRESLAMDDVLHLRAFGFDKLKGKSPIRQHAETIGLGLEAQKYGKSFFGSNGRPTGVLSVKGPLEKTAWERLKETFRLSARALVADTNRTMLLPADLDYKALTISPEDMQFLDTRKFNRSEIAGIFNVPAHMINDLERATFSNITELSVQFVKHTMMPWVINWEQEVNRKLFTREERKAGYYVKMNLAGLLRGTPKERADFYHMAITDGWMSRNEARVLEDMNKVDGLDEMLVSVNASNLQPKGGGKIE
ncbi:MAG: phage portal protein [Plesiomonas sp.]|uniref:phage portal protein n=1 Tax=Plesiomonas sp. TaxID=2486279 RepID=UPI003F3FEBAA